MVRRQEDPKSKWRSIATWTAFALLCLSTLGAGAAWHWISSSMFVRERVLKELLHIAPKAPQDVFNDTSLTVLLLGCDEDRVYGRRKARRSRARSDMMMVAKIDFEKKCITGVSIPRDTLVQLPGYKLQKINAYYAMGALNDDEAKAQQLAKDAAQAVVTVNIDRVIVLDYNALEDMVDLVGGVKLKVKKHLKYDDDAGRLHIDIKAGYQRLDGVKAMQFVRFRHDALGDFGRQDRQKDFLVAFRTAMKASLGLMPEVINKALSAFGGQLNEEEVRSLAHFTIDIGADNIRLGTIPTVDASNDEVGSALAVDYNKLSQVLWEFGLLG